MLRRLYLRRNIWEFSRTNEKHKASESENPMQDKEKRFIHKNNILKEQNIQGKKKLKADMRKIYYLQWKNLNAVSPKIESRYKIISQDDKRKYHYTIPQNWCRAEFFLQNNEEIK